MSKLPRSFQAIITKRHGVTNTLNQRVIATAGAGRVTLEWDDLLGDDANHIAAAQALARKFKWLGKYYIGGLPDGTRVFVSPDSIPAFDNGEG